MTKKLFRRDLNAKRNFCAPLHMAKPYHDALALLHPFPLTQQTPGQHQISAPIGTDHLVQSGHIKVTSLQTRRRERMKDLPRRRGLLLKHLPHSLYKSWTAVDLPGSALGAWQHTLLKHHGPFCAHKRWIPAIFFSERAWRGIAANVQFQRWRRLRWQRTWVWWWIWRRFWCCFYARFRLWLQWRVWE